MQHHWVLTAAMTMQLTHQSPAASSATATAASGATCGSNKSVIGFYIPMEGKQALSLHWYIILRYGISCSVPGPFAYFSVTKSMGFEDFNMTINYLLNEKTAQIVNGIRLLVLSTERLCLLSLLILPLSSPLLLQNSSRQAHGQPHNHHVSLLGGRRRAGPLHVKGQSISL